MLPVTIFLGFCSLLFDFRISQITHYTDSLRFLQSLTPPLNDFFSKTPWFLLLRCFCSRQSLLKLLTSPFANSSLNLFLKRDKDQTILVMVKHTQREREERKSIACFLFVNNDSSLTFVVVAGDDSSSASVVVVVDVASSGSDSCT